MPSAAGPPSSSAADDQPELPSLQEQLTRRRRRGPAPSALDFTRGRRRDRLLRIALVALLFLAVLPLSLGRLLSTRSESPPPPQRKPENSDPDPVPRPAPLPEAAGARGRSLPRLNPTRASATPERRQQAPEASRSPARPDRVVVAATTVAAGAGAQPGGSEDGGTTAVTLSRISISSPLIIALPLRGWSSWFGWFAWTWHRFGFGGTGT